MTEVVSNLKKILMELKNNINVETCAVVSRNGIMMAADLPKGAKEETFALLSATIFGASEVAFTEIGKPQPDKVVVYSENSKLILTSAGPKAILIVTTTEKDIEKVMEEVEKITGKIKGEIM